MVKKGKSTKRDQYTIILEGIRSDFRVFGDGLKTVDTKVDILDTKVNTINEQVGRLTVDMEFVKSELAIIRHNQVTRDEFKLLETRVARLEKRPR